MIQIRRPDGTVKPVPGEGNFVELVNDVDKTVMMVFVQLKPGVILKISPQTADAKRYEDIFKKVGVKFSKFVIVRQ
jgi:hypothetical protein